MNYKELLKKIITEIEKANSIVILRHRKPDPDALGSQIGLKITIELAFSISVMIFFNNSL